MSLGSGATRWRGLVLLAWACGLALLLGMGRYALFIRATLWPLLLASLIILVLFVLATIARGGGGAGKISATGWLRGGMLLLPLLYLCSLLSGAAASGLNSFALQKRSIGLNAASDTLGAGSDADTPELTPGSIINLGSVARHLSGLAGQQIVTEGRVWRDDTLPDGQIVIFRFVVVCCAADAMPVQAVVISPKTAGFKNDDWVRVSGALQIEEKDGDRIPVIRADKIDPIPPPEEPYLSPFQF
jgi:putative membrane protein